MTVLKRMIQTASLVIPSPNTREKSFGYSSYLITAIAATTSVQHKREHISKISITLNVNTSYSLHSHSSRIKESLPSGSIIFPECIEVKIDVGGD